MKIPENHYPKSRHDSNLDSSVTSNRKIELCITGISAPCHSPCTHPPPPPYRHHLCLHTSKWTRFIVVIMLFDINVNTFVDLVVISLWSWLFPLWCGPGKKNTDQLTMSSKIHRAQWTNNWRYIYLYLFIGLHIYYQYFFVHDRMI